MGPPAKTNRNAEIFKYWKRGGKYKALGQVYGVSSTRIQQIVEKQAKKEARKLGCRVSEIFEARKDRKPGESMAANIERRRDVRQFEENARNVRVASEEFAEHGLSDFSDAARDAMRRSARSLNKFKARTCKNEIRTIKRQYDALDPALQAGVKGVMAEQVDDWLAVLKTTGIEIGYA